MKPELSNKNMLYNIIQKNNKKNIDNNINKNNLFFNFLICAFFIICILFLIFRYLEKKKNKKNIDN